MRHITLGKLLEEQARERGDAEFVRFVDTGERLSYREFNRRCNRLANGLADFGVGKGDFVAIMLRNSIDYLLTTYALKKLGAVEVSLNADFRGPGLARTVNLTQSPILVTAAEFLEPLAHISGRLTHLRTLVLVDAHEPSLPGREHVAFADLLAADADDPRGPTEDTELAAILFTSGTARARAR